MIENDAAKQNPDFNRRDFIKGASAGSLMLLAGGTLLQAEDKPAAAPEETNFSAECAGISFALIGCGIWGREILQTIAVLKNTPAPTIVAICDNFKSAIRRAKEIAPKAEVFDDYRKVLESPSVQAVIVATPTHLHKEIVIAALKAGKHVYCEAPIASTVEDARAIAEAARDAVKVNFQAGLQMRSDPGKKYVLNFIRNAAIGTPLMAKGQWHKKDSWRRAWPDPDREKALNWRLDKSVSTGLAGEIGVHQFDLMNWFLNQRPTAVNGFGGIMAWNDGRDVPDTIQTLLHYSSKANFSYDCTLGNSFDGEYTAIYGNFAAILMRVDKAWLFEEADCPLLGWELYAMREKFYQDSGITLSANASHSIQSKKGAAESPYADTALHHALRAFICNCHLVEDSVRDFTSINGADADAASLKDYVAAQVKGPGHKAAAGYQEGLEATVTAVKANEAVIKGERIALPKELFEI